MKHLLWLLLLAAAPVWADTPAPRPVVSEIVELQRGDATGYVGTVTARIAADLGFPLLGTIVKPKSPWKPWFPGAFAFWGQDFAPQTAPQTAIERPTARRSPWPVSGRSKSS